MGGVVCRVAGDAAFDLDAVGAGALSPAVVPEEEKFFELLR